MQALVETYPQHIQELQNRTREAIQREGIDGLIIHSGQSKRMFLDDNNFAPRSDFATLPPALILGPSANPR